MEGLQVAVRDGNIEIHGLADGAKLVEVPADPGKSFAHLGLHNSDLQFAAACLDTMTARAASLAGGPDIMQEALWNAALVATYKCFGDNRARGRLTVADIFGEQRETLDYYWELRRKNVAHDQNDLSQAYVLAILHDEDHQPRVSKTLCWVMDFTHADAGNAAALRSVVDTALAWVQARIDEHGKAIVDELNSWSPEALEALQPMLGRKPTRETISVTRTTPPK